MRTDLSGALCDDGQFVCRGKAGRAARVAWKDEFLGSRAGPCGDAHSLGERRPEDLALFTDDKDERPGN